MRRLTLATVFGEVLLLAALDARAHPESYSPFEPGKEPKPFPVRECVTIEDGDAPEDAAFAPKTVGIKDRRDAPRLRLCPPDGIAGTVLTVVSAEGKVLAGPWYADLYWPGKVQHADLNGDGREDFIAHLHFGGCGLQAAFSQVVFAVSKDGDYVFATVNTYHARDGDFVDLGDGRCRYIQTSFVYGDSETAADGKHHNYWVHSLLAFGRDGKATVDNAADPRFPAWIWYTYEANHQPTRLVTGEQKHRLWARERRIFGAHENGTARVSPDFVAGATEAVRRVVGPRAHRADTWQVYTSPTKNGEEFGLFVRQGDNNQPHQILTSCRVVEAYWAFDDNRRRLVVNDEFASNEDRCLVYDPSEERAWRIDEQARKRFGQLAPPGKTFDHLFASAEAVSPDATKVLLGACGHGGGGLKAARCYVVAIETGEVLAEYREAKDVPLKWWKIDPEASPPTAR